MSWHAAAVHLPLTLAVVWPWVDLFGVVLKRRDVSATAFGLLLLAAAASLVATATGQSEYDAAYAASVSVEVLDRHADVASLVPWVLIGLSAARGWGPSRGGRGGHWGSLGLGFAASVMIVYVGHTGGQLVYEHGVGVASSAARIP